MGRKFGLSFSWKRALGISAAKGKLSKAIGIPLTKRGRDRKLRQISHATLLKLFQNDWPQGQTRTGRDHDLVGQITAQDVEETRLRMESRYEDWKSQGSPNPSDAAITQAKDRRDETWVAWKRERQASHGLARTVARFKLLRFLDCYLLKPFRRLAKWNDIGVVVALLITGTLGASVGAVFAVAFVSSLMSGLIVLATAFLLGIVLPLVAMLIVPGSIAEILHEAGGKQRELDFRRDWAHVQYENAEKEYSRLKNGAVARDRYEVAKQQFETCREIHQLKKNQLLQRDWRSLRGTAFEQFLVELFEELNYSVQTTKASGDQGVDLIVMINSFRVAIQSKGYDSSVGNSSVQEVYAGMQYYHCDACAVITNSHFTRAAIDLARSTGCQLIEGADIPQLIRGELVLVINSR
jgi:hypothetical protein